jgi:lysophospholipase L1-like esterase
MKWLAYGDSVTVPVQMWNIPEALVREYAYYTVAAKTLEKEFGSKIDLVVNAVGGRQLNEKFQSLLDSLASEKPDVLVLFASDTIRNYELFMPRVVKAAAETGTEILVIVPTYDYVPYRCPEFDWLRRYSIENGLACADARRYLLDIPECFWADTVANDAHPNPEGHRLIGEVVAEMFR